jgi:hypothetical protein
MTTFTPMLARTEGPGDLIILVVMGVIWLFSVIADRIRKRNNPAPTKPAEPTPRPAEKNDDLEELQRQLRRMLGGPETEDDPPARPQPPAAPPARRPQPAVIRFDTPAAPPPPPLPMRGSTTSAREVSEVDAFAAVAEIVDIEEAMREPSSRSASVINPNQFLVNLSKLKLPLMRTPVMTMASVKSVVTPPAVQDPAILRQTMIGSILLGPPKGMD